MPSYRPCTANSPDGIKSAAASTGKTPTKKLASFMGAGHCPEAVAYPASISFNSSWFGSAGVRLTAASGRSGTAQARGSERVNADYLGQLVRQDCAEVASEPRLERLLRGTPRQPFLERFQANPRLAFDELLGIL